VITRQTIPVELPANGDVPVRSSRFSVLFFGLGLANPGSRLKPELRTRTLPEPEPVRSSRFSVLFFELSLAEQPGTGQAGHELQPQRGDTYQPRATPWEPMCRDQEALRGRDIVQARGCRRPSACQIHDPANPRPLAWAGMCRPVGAEDRRLRASAAEARCISRVLCLSSVRNTLRIPRLEMRPASGAEPAGRRGAMPTPAMEQRAPRCGRDARAPRGALHIPRLEMRPASGAEPAGRQGAVPTPATSQRSSRCGRGRPRSQRRPVCPRAGGAPALPTALAWPIPAHSAFSLLHSAFPPLTTDR
jgi:hypothetical protein